MGKVKTTRRLPVVWVSRVQRAPRRVCKCPAQIFRGISCVQRAPRRGNETTAQGKRPKGATPWVSPGSVRYAPGGGKSNDRGGNAGNGGIKCGGRRRGGGDGGGDAGDGGGKLCRQIPPVAAFAPSGGVSETLLPNPGCRSLRSLALGWELVAPSGRALNAWYFAAVVFPKMG